MVVSVIQSRLSATDLALKPGLSVATVEVEVINGSDRHASFHILLTATGEDTTRSRRWYHLTPMTSSKVPPGTRSTYTVNITGTPLTDFVGLANVTVRIISPELQSEERHVLRLRVEPGVGTTVLTVELPMQRFQDYPGQQVDIPVRIHNSSRNAIAVSLSCPALDTWLVDERPDTLQLLPNRWQDTLLTCLIPEDLTLSHSQDYPFQVQVIDDEGESASAAGVLEVLPLGYFELIAPETILQLPAQRSWFPNRRANSTQTQLRLENHSNLRTKMQLAAIAPQSWSAGGNAEGGHWQDTCTVSFDPETVTLAPGDRHLVDTAIALKRPWMGWVRTIWIDVQARLTDARLELRNDTETLQVRVAPIIPRWLQLLALLVGAGAIAGLWFLNVYRQHHHQLVSTVEFNGLGTRVVSGSSDETIRQWQIRRWGLRPAGDSLRFDKAIRTLQVRPVDNNQLMVGLENGETQIWDLLEDSEEPLQTLVNPMDAQSDLDDRVLALAATADSRYLFTGHGSGQVHQWYVGGDTANRSSLSQYLVNTIAIPELAIYDLALVGPTAEYLAIVGRYNKLLLWNWVEDSKVAAIAYPSGGQDDYVTSLAAVEQNSSLLATADNQGRIMLWNLEGCFDQPDQCTAIDQWQIDDDAAIRDIAVSANGCFLVSAGDDGRVMLWPLTRQGRRQTKYLEGQVVAATNTQFNSVDIKVVDSRILIVSGADDHRVRLHRPKTEGRSCQQ